MIRCLNLWRALAAMALLVGIQAYAEPTPLGPVASPLWMRYPQISPDGTQIAFAFQGNLFVVPSGGGTARLLVGNGHHSFAPVWSSDGRTIAYASDVHGQFDVFVVDAQGGPSRRLTTHSAPEVPLSFTPDGKEVLFTARRQASRASLFFPAGSASELYKVSVDGGRRPTQIFSTPAMAARFDRSGTRLLYEDWKGYENAWRKHHVSPVARDVWLYDTTTGQHRRLTSFGGEDRNPVWSADEKSVYYLSEQGGSFNVWQMPLDHPESAAPLTHLNQHPVRFLSVSDAGVVCFGYDGELYTLAPGASQPVKVAVRIAADTWAGRVENLKLSEGVTEIAPSPDGSELAFVVRGEVFVASTEFGTTVRITHTPGQERSVSFSPNGRRLLFAGEHEGSWNLYEAQLPVQRKDVPVFYQSATVPVKLLLRNGHENFQPRYSPDGKEVAYLEDRTTIKVLNLASGKTRVVLPGEWNYSYIDGDQWFDWSPDGRWLLVNFLDRQRWSSEVGLIDAQGKGPLVNLTKSGYEDLHPVFTQGGKAMMWASDRMGFHATGGAAQQDLYEMFFNQAALDRFNLDKGEFALLKKQEDEEAKKAAETKAPEKKAPTKASAAKAAATAPDDEEAIKLPEPLAFDVEHVEDRIARLTPNSASLLAAAMTPDGETVFYAIQLADTVELWSQRPRTKSLKKLAEVPSPKQGQDDGPPPADVQLDAKGENGFLLAAGTIRKFKVPKEEGDIKVEPLEFSAEVRLDRAAERAAMFEHIWRQMREKLYDVGMEKVDWAGYKKAYQRYLPYIVDNVDFAEAMSEMLGELNVSHTGAGYVPNRKDADATAALGAFFDDAWPGPGIKIAEVIDGGPLVKSSASIRAGMVIEKVDGNTIEPGGEYDSLLNNKAGKRVELSLLDPASGLRIERILKPIAVNELNELLYRRWVHRERELVDKLSNGRLGYVHVRGMDDESYRDVFSEVLGRASAKEALIVDTRFNGGGNLHDELATLLSGRRYYEFVPRGQSIGWEPTGKWVKPSVVLISESNYSDAHLFPWVYRKLGIGRLVGMPVAGTGTAVWWETLPDDTLYFGIPEVGHRDLEGHWMEKELIVPDIQVANDPAMIGTGRDQQLEAAVKALLGLK